MADRTTGGIQIQGLDESVRALVRLNPKFRKEAEAILVDGARKLQRAAQSKIGDGGYRMGMQRGMIARTKTTIRLNSSKYPWALQAEFGERWANIPAGRSGGTRYRRQSSFKLRTAAPFKPPTSSDPSTNRGGYMIQPSLLKLVPKLTKEAGVRITRLVTKEMRAQGVKARNG